MGVTVVAAVVIIIAAQTPADSPAQAEPEPRRPHIDASGSPVASASPGEYADYYQRGKKRGEYAYDIYYLNRPE